MLNKKLPSLQFYPGDWRKDPGIQALGYFERGVWFEILLLMHESEDRGKLLLNGKKMPDEALAQALGLDKQILTTTLTKILEYGVASIENGSGILICRRMIRDEKIRKIRTKAGKKGGNPLLIRNNLLNQNPTTEVKQKTTPSSSSSSSISFNTFWSKYPKKVGMEDAVKAWKRIGKVNGADTSEILKAVDGLLSIIERDKTEPRYIKNPASFLNADRWRDYLPDGPLFIEPKKAWSLEDEMREK